MLASVLERSPKTGLATLLAVAVTLASCFGAGLAQPGSEAPTGPSGIAREDAAEAAPLRRVSSGPSRDCRYAWYLEVRVADRLAHEARQLAACAERGDVRNACQDSFWRVRNAQRDYESSISSIKATCEQHGRP